MKNVFNSFSDSYETISSRGLIRKRFSENIQ